MSTPRISRSMRGAPPFPAGRGLGPPSGTICCTVPWFKCAPAGRDDESMKAENIAKVCNVIGEGPRWNAAEQRLYWVDFIENQNIHSWQPATQELLTYRTEAPVTALGFRRTGGLIVATRGQIATFNLATKTLSAFTTVDDRPSMRLNDGAVDANGRFWVGSMNSEKPEEPHGSLYRFDPDGTVHMMDR